MSGTNPVATWVDPVNTVQDPATYKAALDGDAQVAKRIVNAFAPHQTATPAMTVTLEPGAVLNGVTLTEKALQVTGTITAPVTNPRIDRVVIDAVTGVVSVIAGAESASPVPPAIAAGKLPVAQVLLQTSSATITNSMITDERPHLLALTGSIVEAWSAQLDSVAALATNGLVARTAANTVAGRTLTGTANQVAVTNGDGVAGNPTLALPSSVAWGTGTPNFGILTKRKTADESVTSSVALQDDDHLVAPIAANEEWVYTIAMNFGDVLDSTGLKWAINVPAGATLRVDYVMAGSGGGVTAAAVVSVSSVTADSLVAQTAGQFTAGAIIALVRATVWVLNGATPGNVTVRWAQGTSSATPLTAKKGGQMIGVRVA